MNNIELYKLCEKAGIDTYIELKESIRPVGLGKKGGLYRKLSDISKFHDVQMSEWKAKICNMKTDSEYRALILYCKKRKSPAELKLLYKHKTGLDYVPSIKYSYQPPSEFPDE